MFQRLGHGQPIALGGMQISGLVVYARKDVVAGGLQKPTDIVKAKNRLFSGMAPEHGRMIISALGLQLIGAKYDYLAGYPSSGATRAALMSGETNITVDAAHANLNQDAPEFEKNGDGMAIFSTLLDSHLPFADGLFIGGGFPETQLEALATNQDLMHDIRAALAAGMPAYAECGGLMYLARSINWRGHTREIVGFVPADVIVAKHPQGRGYM